MTTLRKLSRVMPDAVALTSTDDTGTFDTQILTSAAAHLPRVWKEICRACLYQSPLSARAYQRAARNVPSWIAYRVTRLYY